MLTEVGGRGAREVAVEVGAVALLEAGAEPEVAELDVATCVQQQVVGLYIPATQPHTLINLWRATYLCRGAQLY